jgi:hypothetical protein
MAALAYMAVELGKHSRVLIHHLGALPHWRRRSVASLEAAGSGAGRQVHGEQAYGVSGAGDMPRTGNLMAYLRMARVLHVAAEALIVSPGPRSAGPAGAAARITGAAVLKPTAYLAMC